MSFHKFFIEYFRIKSPTPSHIDMKRKCVKIISVARGKWTDGDKVTCPPFQFKTANAN